MTALKVFEAAARHLSLKKAAEELNVTPAAVSHQIQQLEDFLGVRLFHRGHRSIALTESAYLCLPKLQEGFDCLRQAMDKVTRRPNAGALSIGASSAFLSKWLMPRLYRFVTRHPEIDLHIPGSMRQSSAFAPRCTDDCVAQWADEVDVVIAFGYGDYAGLQSQKLMSVSVTPLCSPALLAGNAPLAIPSDVLRYTLIHDNSDGPPGQKAFWDIWFDAMGVSCAEVGPGPRFTDSALALAAAMAGVGIVAGLPELAAADMAAGRLVAPFAPSVPLSAGYHVVSNALASKREAVETFRQWLMAEATQA
jgi:LysR family glycine cleavage system transcriptional activator